MSDQYNNSVNDIDAERVSKLLSTLPHIEAPADFHFGVKARIERRRTAKPRWFASWNVAAASVSAVLILLFGGYILYLTNVVSPVENTVVSAVDNASPTLSLPVDQPAAVTKTPELAAGNAAVVEQSRTNTATSSTAPSSKPVAGASSDSAASSSTRIYPKGVGPNSVSPQKPHDLQRERTFTAKEVLDQLGVETGEMVSGIRVIAVRENSVAAKSGLKNGDVIEAINKKPVSTRSSFTGQFSGRMITVRRDGKSFDLEIKP